MVTTAGSVGWTVVGTEVEALQLEYNWIKEFDPRFNIRYRDDKSYPVLAVTLNEAREVVQLAPMQSLIFGERDGKLSDRVRAIDAVFKSGNFGAVASEHILHDMWEKWVFLASLAASTSLMRTSPGNILAAPGGVRTYAATGIVT